MIYANLYGVKKLERNNNPRLWRNSALSQKHLIRLDVGLKITVIAGNRTIYFNSCKLGNSLYNDYYGNDNHENVVQTT